MGYKITISINDDDITSESVQKAASYISETLGTMRISHSIECHKEKMKLMKLSK